MKSIYQRHLAVTTGLILFFVFLGFAASFLTVQFEASQTAASRPVFFAKMIGRIWKTDPKEALSVLRDVAKERPQSRYWLLDASGTPIYPEGLTFPVDWASLPHPTVPYEPLRLEQRQTGIVSTLSHLISGAPPGSVIRLDGEPARYLVMEVDHRRNVVRRVFLLAFASMVVASVLGTVLSLTILYRSLRARAREADAVISELQKGNLKARFPIRKLDEIGQAMVRFNRMADEIESLVERLKTAEEGRMALLEELAHDLRTPIASVRSMLETLKDHERELEPSVRAEFTALSLREVEYFGRLVEDLLTLAHVNEPRYKSSTQWVQVEALLNDELENLMVIRSAERPGLEVHRDFEVEGSSIPGDPHLLRRLFRNALENAFSFAQSKVAVQARRLPGDRLEILLQDDGQGLSEEALQGFGARRGGPRWIRQDRSEAGGRLSIGLGSVIMRAIASVHRGEMLIRNQEDRAGKVVGAELRIILPTH